MAALTVAPFAHADAAGFPNWIAGFRGRARAAGISDRTFDAAFADVRYLQDSIDRDRNQAEFVRPLADYLSSAVSDTRVVNGRDKVGRFANVLAQIEARFDVEPQVVTAVWGMESNYGQRRGDTPLISTLATLAYDGRRGEFFESQLIAALKILQNGDVSPRDMTGSWAGAMGHTQFIPTSYEAYAVDFTGDGRRDIWADDPTDALASTAAYFRRFNWTKGQPWGVEVRLPAGFDFSQTSRSVTRNPSDWARVGVVGVDGRAVPDYGEATLSTPTGAGGPAFLLFRNYDVIGRYNNAEAYIIGVGHLSDRIRGLGPLSAPFPPDERRLLRAERTELQQRLTNAGFSTGGVDGRIGPNTRAAIRAYQRSVGLPPDGHPSYMLLQRLR
ncbi:MAG: lytic murein transglycosylase [Yoonia sp.]|uniref:lytic murein transglycosylase n=1 Tax=Yoonia sp. TaxID=2212373 RepID=UPI00273D3C9B|nr:lytic murein transglycosylase [Yoonia sp.]MDP5084959.1 lytic murein transglycosylase [Yoonia sp.]